MQAALGNRWRLVISGIAGEVLALCALHHLWNLWGLSWDKQLLSVVFVGPALGLIVAIALAGIDSFSAFFLHYLERAMPRSGKAPRPFPFK